MQAPTRAMLLLVALFSTTKVVHGACDNCLNKDRCDSISGYCTDFQCAYNWTNQPKCDTPCSPLTWGTNCVYDCHCPINDTCNVINGVCGTDTCAPRWYGIACQKRMTELYDPPVIVNATTNGSLLQWTRWSRLRDYGDGPAASYTVQFCKEFLSESCWQVLVNGTVMEPNATSPATLQAWVPGSANTTYWYRVITNMFYYGVIVNGFPSRASLPITLPSPPINTLPSELPPVGAVAVSTNATSAMLVWQQPLFSTVITSSGSAILQVLYYNVTYALAASLSMPGTCRYASIAPSAASGNQLVLAPKTSLLISNLLPFVQYSLAVQVVYTANYSSNATQTSLSTAASAPTTVPDDITAREISSVSVMISWMQPLCSVVTGPIVRYDVRILNDRDIVAATVSVNNPNGTEAKITGLQPRTNYSATVRIVNAVDVGPWGRSELFRTLDDLPPQPVNVNVSNVSATRAVISWSFANSTATIKSVTIAIYETGRVGCPSTERLVYIQTVTAGESQQQLDVQNLSPWTSYSAKMLSSNDLGNSTATVIFLFETLASAPTALVANLSVTNVTARGMLVTWSALSCGSANGLLLWYDVAATPSGGGSSGFSGPTTLRTTSSAASPTSAWLTGLQPSTLYSVSVRAVNLEGAGPWANASSLQLTASEAAFTESVCVIKWPAPSTVSSLTLATTQTSVVARWVSPAKNFSVQLIKVGPIACGGRNDESSVSLASGFSNSSYTSTGLSPGVRYRIKVAAINDVGVSDAAIAEFVTASSTPNGSLSTPSLNYNPSSNRLSITWAPIPCEAVYGIFQQYEATIVVNGNQIINKSSSIPLIEVSDVIPNANYSVQVRVVNDIGPGNWSSRATAVSPNKIAPLPVASINISASYSEASASWDATNSSSQGVTYSANLELLKSGACSPLQQPLLVQTLHLDPTTVQASPAQRVLTMPLTGLQAWSDYRLTVTVRNDVGAASVSANFTTLSGSRPTVAVSNVLASNVTTLSALGSWQPLPCDAWTSPDVVYRYQLANATGSVIATNTTRNTSVLFASLSTYRSYSLTVQAAVGVNFGPSSAAVSFTTLLAAPTRVRFIDVNVTSPSGVQLRWPSPAADDAPVSTYEIVYQRLATGGCPASSPSYFGTPTKEILVTTSLTIEALQPWSTYAVWLSASNVIGSSPNASTTFNLTYDVPDASLSLTGRALSDTRLTYNWSQPDCLRVRGPLLGYEFKLVAQPSSAVVRNGTTNSVNVTFSQLLPYTEYTFAVRVKNSAGSGLWSFAPALSTFPADPPAPSNISLLSAASPTELLIGFDNTDAANVLRYCLTYAAIDESSSAGADQATAGCTQEGSANNSFTVVRVSNLLPYKSYSIQVRLGTVAGWSSNVVSAVLRTDSSVPSEPTSLSLVDRNETSLSFAWQVPLSPNGQLISYQLSYSLCSDSSSSSTALNCSTSDIGSSSDRTRLLTGLCPGACYRVAAAAATDKGLGNATAVEVYTTPGQPATPPIPQLLGISSSTVTVRIFAVLPLFGPVTSYLIFVSKSLQNRKRSAILSAASASTASDGARPIYAEIAASDVPTDGYVIVLGDNRTTAGGRYISMPLEPSTSYDISQVTVSTLSNVTRMSSQVTLTVVTSPAPVAVLPFWIWILVAVACIFLIFLIVILFVYCRRKHRLKQEKAVYENYNISDNDLVMYRDQLELINNQSWPDGGKDEGVSTVAKPVWHGYWNLIYKLESPRYVLTDSEQQQLESGELGFNGLSISFDQEFHSLPRGRQSSCDVAQKEINADLNRVAHIVPYDASRVKLFSPMPATGTDYVNASYIRGYDGHPAYIATACPFNDKTRAAFWSMIVQESVEHIVMVTNLVDGNIVKTSRFWPALHRSAEVHGDIAVQNVSVSTLANFAKYRLSLHCGGGGDGYSRVRREVTLYHFTSWPEHGVPSDVLPFLEFCHVVRDCAKHNDNRNKGLIAVMCGTGVSTTGVFIAADVLMDQANREDKISIYNVVRCLREDRMHMVRTLRQYYFLCDLLFEHLICKRMTCRLLALRERYKRLASEQREDRKGFSGEFDVLQRFTPKFTKEQCRDAGLDENKAKNYSIHMLPPDDHRPVLKGAGGLGNDYINAVFVDGYVVKTQYIITQTPLENTVVDFWKLVYEQNVTAIVTLDEPLGDGSNSFRDPFAAWLPLVRLKQAAEHSPDQPPAVGAMTAIAYGPFWVKCVAQETTLHFISRRLKLHNKLCPSEQPRDLLQLHLTDWPLRGRRPPKTADLFIALYSNLERWMTQPVVSHWDQPNSNSISRQRSDDAGSRLDSRRLPLRVLAHCSDGVSRSGLFVAACALCERISIESTINVFHVVKALRMRRPQAVIGEEQYKFLYRLAWDYYHTRRDNRDWSRGRTEEDGQLHALVTATAPRQSGSFEMPRSHADDYYDNEHDDTIGDGPRQKQRLVR